MIHQLINAQLDAQNIKATTVSTLTEIAIKDVAEMTYFQKNRSTHNHRYFVDANTGTMICMCGKLKDAKDQPKNKYRNIPNEYKGHIYDSKFEADCAADLDWRCAIGEVMSWTRQNKLDLKVNGQHITNYYIDFIALLPDGSREFIEAKGMALDVWKIKWRLLEATFNDFKEHPDDKMVLIKETSSWWKKHARTKKLST